MKKFTTAIIGCGSRGCVYGNCMYNIKDKFEIVCACDNDQIRLSNAQKMWKLSSDQLFIDEQEFFQKKRADVLVIATQDRDHVRMCSRALELGYNVLLEKPISPIKDELYSLLDAQEKHGGEVVVCHVLRYAPAFLKIKEILDSGIIGKLIRIESIEQVSYWHQAHSFVRGNWRNDQETSPMIMQKCCHDFDLMQYYVGAKCDTVYSVGDLKFFNKSNQPEGAADRCAECKYINDCPYSAEKLYIDRWKADGKPEFGWPYNVVDSTMPNTEESIRKAYTDGQYGRCVFACDNNVVDNQSVEMRFANGVNVTLIMTAFTEKMGRKMTFHGSLGEIIFDDSARTLSVCRFGKDKKEYSVDELVKDADGLGHGGGDARLVDDFYKIIANGVVSGTNLVSSVESHLIALASEKSRKTGTIVTVHE